jgi:hypothetical protein
MSSDDKGPSLAPVGNDNEFEERMLELVEQSYGARLNHGLESAAALRKQAEKAVRLARGSTDPLISASLDAIAADFLSRADDLDREGSRKEGDQSDSQ